MAERDKNDIRKRLEELRKDNNRKNNRQDNGDKPPFSGFLFFVFVVLLVVFTAIFHRDIQTAFQNKKEISYTEFVGKTQKGDFTEINEKDDKLIAQVKEDGKDVLYFTKKITDRVGNEPIIINAIAQKRVKLNSLQPSGGNFFLLLLGQFLPMIIMIGLMVYLARKMVGGSQGGGPGNIFGFGKSRVNKIDKKPDVKFDDVAGVDGAKEELKEVVDFLKNPEKYTKAGARVPKGVLLLGRPGTGKTLLAKAVAGESGASFFSIPGSEFVEMFVGVGASRVRDLFEKAKESSPSIIFIDEIDAIGRRRSVGKNSGSNDEREQTLNQLLVEMDGFETDTKVIVLAATNREDVLDPALLRAGRFDRRVTVDAPDLQGRVAILKVHSRNKKLDSDVRLEDIAKITPGFVGADLANLLNEAAILAARRASDTIKMADLDEAVDKIGMGLGQKGKIIKPEEKKLLAYHEAGHAIMTELTPGADPVHKVTIIPRGDAGGFMMPLPEEKLVTTSRQMLAEIKVLFGGRAAEEIGLDDISTGAYSDIKRATKVARAYVESVGMSKKLGPINFENSDDEYSFAPNKSDETVREIDLEIRKILTEEYLNTLNTLQDNWSKLEEVVKLLLKKETITGDEVRRIIKGETSEQILKASENIEEDNNNSNIEEEKKAEEEDTEKVSEEKLIEKVEELEEKIKTEKLAEAASEIVRKTDEVLVNENQNTSESELEKVTETKDKKDNDDNSNDSSENNDNDSDSGNEDINEKSENSEKKKSNFKLPSFME
ncbi:ATP-dependent zinc metalloprotease FtsH [Leptotrichia sp. oral taxon 879]|uniref:ATP-dependent zinc metalloprotease FtsH n=1 Tax=Leptotrichia sp. oral taxon 879 TaxID=1227267 RepID=UPI0003ADFA39|nr:ATP-dependent zinc metalloprotease FtsH [Leptotrichia sp. oral taxon 879]ERK47719.1 ATP-dependent metallopeptidase HflB [Leptotrichia sp. oral taxon 879 str. F0557]